MKTQSKTEAYWGSQPVWTGRKRCPTWVKVPWKKVDSYTYVLHPLGTHLIRRFPKKGRSK